VTNKRFNKDTIKHLFGASSEAMNAFIALSTDNGAKFGKLMKDMGAKSGAAKAAFDRLSQTPEHLAKVLKTNLQEALVKVGQAMEPVVVRLLRFATGVVQSFNAVPKPIREFAVQAFAAASAAVALVGAVASAKAMLTAVATAARVFGLSAGGGLVSALGPAVLIIGVAAAALYAFKYAVDNNLDGIGDTFHALVDGVKLAFDTMSQLFTTGGLSGAARDEFLKGGNAFVNFGVKVYLVVNRIQEFLSALVDGFTEVADEIDFGALSEALTSLSEAFGSLKNDAGESGDAFDAFGRAGVVVGNILGGVAKVVVAVFTAAVNVVAGFAGAWDTFVAPALGVVSDAFGELYDALSDAMGGLSDALGLGGDTGEVFRAVGAVIANVFGGALKVVGSVVKFVAGNIRSLGTIVGGVVGVVKNLLTGQWGAAWDSAKTVVSGLIDYVVGGLAGMMRVVADTIDAIAGLAGVDLGLGKKMEAFQVKAKAWAHDATGVPAVTPRGAGPVTSSSPAASPAVAAVPPPGVTPDMLFGSVAAMTKGSGKPTVVQVQAAPVMLDGVKVGEVLMKSGQQTAAASFQPMSLSTE
jgi:hypothetical protein